MRKHLFTKQKPCPAVVNDIVLGADIKQHILENRVYKVKDESKIINQTINNNNTINNFIAGLDVFTKLKELTAFRNKPLLDFETKVEELYGDDVERFQNDGFRGTVRYEKDHFIDMIHNMTRADNNDMDDMCVFYDSDEDRVYFSTGNGQWEDYMCDPGIRYLVDTLVSYNLENYEVYLIRKLEERATLGELTASLEDYYRFIATFRVMPWVHNKSDAQLLDSECGGAGESDCGALGGIGSLGIGDNEIACKYMRMYERIKDELTLAQRKLTARAVVDVIKTTTKTNIRELNKRIMGFLNVDEGFKQDVLRAISA